MKNIYLFQYQFDPCPSVHSPIKKRGLLNYKTYIIVDFDREPTFDDESNYIPYEPREEAIRVFIERFPHVDMNTVEISRFNGDMIDFCEVAQ